MNPKLKQVLKVVLLIGLLLGMALVRKFRLDHSTQKQRESRITNEVRDSIANSMKDIKLCPLSEPNCTPSTLPSQPPR